MECPICYEKLDDTKIKLKCGHEFHYKCILTAYKASQKNNNRSYKQCPYCRLEGGYLELRDNTYPIKGIHKEFQEIYKYLILNNFEKIKEITKDYLDKNKCQSILKTGVNKGHQCKKYKKNNCSYCCIHEKHENKL